MNLRILLNRLFQLGTRQNLAPPVSRRVVLSNQIACVLAVIVILGLATNSRPQDSAMQTGFLLFAGIAIAVPLLNYLGYVSLSRLVLVFCPPLMLMAPFAAADSVTLGQLLALPYAFVAMSLLPLLLFDERSEAILWRAGVAVAGLVLLMHESVLAGSLSSADRIRIQTEFADLKLAALVLWVLIFASIRFLTRVDRDG